MRRAINGRSVFKGWSWTTEKPGGAWSLSLPGRGAAQEAGRCSEVLRRTSVWVGRPAM